MAIFSKKIFNADATIENGFNYYAEITISHRMKKGSEHEHLDLEEFYYWQEQQITASQCAIIDLVALGGVKAWADIIQCPCGLANMPDVLDSDICYHIMRIKS